MASAGARSGDYTPPTPRHNHPSTTPHSPRPPFWKQLATLLRDHDYQNPLPVEPISALLFSSTLAYAASGAWVYSTLQGSLGDITKTPPGMLLLQLAGTGIGGFALISFLALVGPRPVPTILFTTLLLLNLVSAWIFAQPAAQKTFRTEFDALGCVVLHGGLATIFLGCLVAGKFGGESRDSEGGIEGSKGAGIGGRGQGGEGGEEKRPPDTGRPVHSTSFFDCETLPFAVPRPPASNEYRRKASKAD